MYEWWQQQNLKDTLLIYHCDHWIFTYPLWNINLNNRIQYVSFIGTANIWEQKITGADWILVSRGSREEGWTDLVSGFIKVYTDDKFVVYQKKI
jgi:hypothetical protein